MQNVYSRSFKVICFDVDEKPLGNYIGLLGLIYDIATTISNKKAQLTQG